MFWNNFCFFDASFVYALKYFTSNPFQLAKEEFERMLANNNLKMAVGNLSTRI